MGNIKESMKYIYHILDQLENREVGRKNNEKEIKSEFFVKRLYFH